MKNEVINLGVGKADDIEVLIYDFMVKRAAEKGIEWAIENQWGENEFVLNGIAYTVQWSYVGLESEEYEEDDKGEWHPVGPWYWEYDGPDFEVDSLWTEQ